MLLQNKIIFSLSKRIVILLVLMAALLYKIHLGSHITSICNKLPHLTVMFIFCIFLPSSRLEQLVQISVYLK